MHCLTKIEKFFRELSFPQLITIPFSGMKVLKKAAF